MCNIELLGASIVSTSVSNRFGYVRVSSKDQNEDRQMIEMEKFGIPKANVFVDKQSGKDFNRPEYQKMLNKLKSGDLVYVLSIDSENKIII